MLKILTGNDTDTWPAKFSDISRQVSPCFATRCLLVFVRELWYMKQGWLFKCSSGRLRTSSIVRYQVLTAASKNLAAFWGYCVVESVTRWPTFVRCLLPLAFHSSARALACYVTRRRSHGFLSRGTTITTTTIGLRVRMPLQTCLCFPCRSLATVYTSSVLSVCLNKSAESWKKRQEHAVQ
jgi:hypothetical protein